MNKTGIIKVSGSEYSPGENAVIYAQVFDGNGDPANTATVILNLFRVDGSKLYTDEAMSYISGSNGIYQFAFAAPDTAGRMIADVSATSPVAYGTEDIGVTQQALNINVLKKHETGRWRILDNKMYMYDEDAVTPLFTYDLLDANGNPTMTTIFERRPG